MQLRFYILLLSLLLAAGAVGSFYYHAVALGSLRPLEAILLPQEAPVEDNTQVAALLAALPDTTLAKPQKSKNCEVRGPLPDPECTPGSVFAAATPEVLCTPGYTKTVRSVSSKLRQALFGAYGIPYPQPQGSFELDHLVPLELGGDNSTANLFPEAATPNPGFKEKDLVENYLHQEVCAGRLPLAAAQKQIALNWLAVYEALSPQTIAQLKRQYHSWAN
jgi:hypothetical protein